jgi:phosphatidylglycerol:prolipoprotein diacylglycerol transferase
MLVHPQFDPIAVAIGPLAVRWYGLMYVLRLRRLHLARPPAHQDPSGNPMEQHRAGRPAVLGRPRRGAGRAPGPGAVLRTRLFLQPPLEDILAVWKGGMSFHGGLIGVLLALAWHARKTGRSFLQVGDFVAPLVPLGLMFGRIGNFINGELWGRPADPSACPGP